MDIIIDSKSDEEQKSGFFDLPISKICKHPQHNPPMHLHIPPGKGYKYKCPACGHITTIVPPQIFP